MDRLTAMEMSVRAVGSGPFSGIAMQPRFGQPAVLKAIAQLENRPGIRLLMRSAYYPTATTAGRSFPFGPFRLLATERLLEKVDERLALGGRAFDILIALVERDGEVVRQREPISRVWSHVTVEEANLRVHSTYHRKALGDGRGSARYIGNIPGRGYCFVAPVTRRAQRAFRDDRLSYHRNLRRKLDRGGGSLPRSRLRGA
jgi:DNA-binding winged helix-turn-helix (wHTH) protein